MFKFEDPIYLWLLWIVPILVLIRFLAGWRRRKKLQKLGDPDLLCQLMPGVSKLRPACKFWLLMAAVALMIVMLARPQMGSKVSNDKRNGIENLVDNFTNDKIGLVVFAGDAFVQLPITNDYVSAKMFLQSIDPSLISTQGTDIARAISLAASSFTQQQGVGRAIILITDGEDHEGGAEEAAKAARKKGINVFILGVGSTKGAPIPVGNGEYMKDRSGNIVMSSLNEPMCREVAQAGSGTYIHVDNSSDAQEKLNSELAKLQKGETQSVVYSDYAEQFQAFGIIVILLLIIEACLLEVKNPLFRNVMLFNKKRL